jgi:hypothetical protein
MFWVLQSNILCTSILVEADIVGSWARMIVSLFPSEKVRRRFHCCFWCGSHKHLFHNIVHWIDDNPPADKKRKIYICCFGFWSLVILTVESFFHFRNDRQTESLHSSLFLWLWIPSFGRGIRKKPDSRFETRSHRESVVAL